MRDLETPRLILRPLQASDLDELHKLYGDERVMQFITGNPRTREMSNQRLAAHLHDQVKFGFGLCAAITKIDHKFVGRCGLEPQPEADGMAGELAWLFAPGQWRQGYGSEAGRTLVEFGLDELNLNRVFATADYRNTASIAIMRKLGMSLVREDERGVQYEIRQ